MYGIIDNVRFPLRVRRNRTHVYILDAEDRAIAAVPYSRREPQSYAYAELICKAQARALTEGFGPEKPKEETKHRPGTDEELVFSVELWFDDDSAVQQVLARFAKSVHAQLFFDSIRAGYHGRTLRVRQGIRVIWETKGLD